jgi:predicted acyltransferase
MTTPSDPQPAAQNPVRRILSIDQFRGYTVAGMFLVNYMGHFKNIPDQLKHNQTWFSYADTIMPSFLFISGVSYRLSLKRRLERGDAPASVYGHAILRGLALILVSLAMYGAEDLGGHFKNWAAFSPDSIRDFIMSTLKANLWEVLAIIGACQILILPLVMAPARTRLAALVALPILHMLLSWIFNYNFVYGRPNPLDAFWGVPDQRAWDGGFFGLLMWSVPMLAGTLVWDLQSRNSPRIAVSRLVFIGAIVMILGYALSCPMRLWDLNPQDDPAYIQSLASDPILPRVGRGAKSGLADFLAPPPFTPAGVLSLGDVTSRASRSEPPTYHPPDRSGILANYWIMDKKVTSASFIIFATGFALALHGLFVLLCDLGSLHVPVFRTLGTNPLAAYAIHHAVEGAVHTVAPGDSPAWWAWASFALFFFITWLLVRGLEKQKIFIKI